MILAMDRFFRKIIEGIVHPSHVPFHPEPESADVGRS